MDTLMENPGRCDHPLQFVTLKSAKQCMTGGGAYVADAIVHCHKCGAEFHLCSDYTSGYDTSDHSRIPIMQLGKGAI